MLDSISALLRRKVRVFLTKRKYAISRMNELTRLADLLGSDKGTRLSAHLYTRVYDKLFSKFRYRPICLLEIGLARREVRLVRSDNHSIGRAPSLEMWRIYFPKAAVFGFDIDDFSGVNILGCTILRGDAGSRENLQDLLFAIGRPIDVVIDDGSHASHHQQLGLGVLFPQMASGGMYIIEDLHWQDERIEKENAPKTRQLLRKLQVQGTFESPYLTDDERKYIQNNVAAVWLFDSLTNEVDDASDALAILIKR